MKKQIATIALASVLGFSVAQAENVANDLLGDISISTTVGFESEYVFRGIKQYGPAIQPAVDISKPLFEGDIYVGFWGSYPISNSASGGGVGTVSDAGAYQETDFYVGYGQELTEHISVDFGYTYYGFFDTGGTLNPVAGDTTGAGVGVGNSDRWHEVYLGLTFDGILPDGLPELNPSIYGYYNPTIEGWIVEGSIGHSIDLENFVGSANWTLDLGANVGVVSSSDVDGDQNTNTAAFSDPEDGYTYWGSTADLVYTFNDVASWSVGMRYAGNNNESQKADLAGNVSTIGLSAPEHTFWWGTSMSFGF